MKILSILGAQSCQIFEWAQKMRRQNMQFLRALKKVASLGAFMHNAKVAEKPHRFDRHRSKIGPNPNVLAYYKSS